MMRQIRIERPILVVDDNNSTRYSTVRFLRAAGVQVLEAVTGEQAIAMAPECDAVILDVNLPDMDGFEVCRRLREGTVNPRVPVIHLTAQRLRDEDKILGLESGADAYLTHPVDPGVLAATVNALLRARAAEYSEQVSRARFEAMFRTAPVGFALVDAAGRLLESNKELHRILGAPSEGGDLAELVHDILDQHADGIVAEHASTPIRSSRLRPDLYLDCRIADPGHGTRLVCIVDMSHQRSLEGERERLLESEREARRNAEEANRAKDSFLALLSHELRNPLAPISSAASLLQMAPQDAATVHHASNVIARQVGHMKELIDDLMDVSRVTRGLVALERAPLDLRPVLDAALEQVRPLLESRNHTLQIAAPPHPVVVDGDRTRLVQVVANLLNNAAKYTPPGGAVRLELAREDDGARIRVIDNGMGIAPALLPRVFDLFTQAERTPDRAQGGLGVGLALVRSVVQLHGGRVHAHSAGEGLGSTFTVALPASRSEVKAKDRPASPAPVSALRILLVDDNVDAASTLADCLRLAGQHVTVRHDSHAALEAAQDPDARFDVFVLDIGLPQITGYALAMKLRAMPRWKDALFVALTGYGQAIDHALSRQAGFDRHLVKPIGDSALLEALSELTAHRSTQRAQSPEPL